MRGFVRIGLTVAALGLGLTLAGCDDFDPTAIFDFRHLQHQEAAAGDSATPYSRRGRPACRRAFRRNWSRAINNPPKPRRPPQTTATATPKQAAAEPSEPKPKLKPKVKPKLVAKPAEQPTQTAGAAPEQATSQTPAAQSQWPDPPQQQAPPPAGGWPASPQASGGTAWPRPTADALIASGAGDRPASASALQHELHGRHRRTAECRQVQPCSIAWSESVWRWSTTLQGSPATGATARPASATLEFQVFDTAGLDEAPPDTLKRTHAPADRGGNGCRRCRAVP